MSGNPNAGCRALTAAVQTHHDAMHINAPAALLLHVADAIAHALAALDCFSIPIQRLSLVLTTKRRRGFTL
jgi:hypothetical protein